VSFVELVMMVELNGASVVGCSVVNPVSYAVENDSVVSCPSKK
jgi:hypothetical protein